MEKIQELLESEDIEMVLLGCSLLQGNWDLPWKSMLTIAQKVHNYWSFTLNNGKIDIRDEKYRNKFASRPDYVGVKDPTKTLLLKDLKINVK